MSRAAAVAVVVITAMATAACGHHPVSLERLSSPANFTNGRDAAGALATISDRLLRESSTCHKVEAGEVRCQTLGAIVAWTQVSAVEVAHCGRAGALEARRTLLGLLASRAAADHHRLASPPAIPPTPACR